MRRKAAGIFLCFLALSFAQAKKPGCSFRVHLEANSNDSDVFSTKLFSATTGKPIVIEKIPRISEQDVLAFYPYDGTNGTYGALFQLSEHGALMLDSMSVERRGAFVYIFVNGRPVAEQQIDKRITDGKIFIPTGLTQADLASMAKEWRVIGRPKLKK